MAKTAFIVLRFEPEDLERLQQAAEESHLAPATWARQQLLRAVERTEKAKKKDRGT